MSGKLLVVITESPPSCKGEEFLTNELPFLRQEFEKVLIIHHNPDFRYQAVHGGYPIIYFRYLPTWTEKLQFPFLLFHHLFISELYNIIFRLRIFPSITVINSALGAIVFGRRLESELSRICAANSDYHPYLYSYWCNFVPVGLSMLKKKRPSITCVSRAHGSDVFFERHKNNYLPHRRLIYKTLNAVFFISMAGLEYSIKKISWYPSMRVAYLGSLPLKISRVENKPPQNILTIVSCSSVIPVKRVNLIAKALGHWNCKQEIHWIHFGDGPNLQLLRQEVEKITSPQVKITLEGYLPNPNVLAYYSTNQIDLFINVSESEGIPYAMIEAAAACIPLMGTSVGGIPELVSKENGILLPPNPTPQEIARQLQRFADLSQDERNRMGKSSFEIWKVKFNAANNFERFAKSLATL